MELDPNTSPETLAKLASDFRTQVRRRVARHPNTLPDTLAQLAGDPRVTVRRVIAGNPNTPLEVLVRLAKDSSVSVRSGVAGNPNTPPEILMRLSGDSSAIVRYEIAWNSAAPPEALVRLANDSESFIRSRVAKHHNTPRETLAQLADDSSINVRYGVAWNPNAPPEALAKFTRVVTVKLCYKYKTKAVRTVIPDLGPVTIFTDNSLGLNPVPLCFIPHWLAPAAITRGQCAIAVSVFIGTYTNRRISKDRLERLVFLVRPAATASSTPLPADTLSGSKVETALDPNTPPKVLAQLANDSSTQVRMMVAQNLNTPPETLARLSEDPDEYVRKTVAYNPNIPPEALVNLTQVVTVSLDRGYTTKAVQMVVPAIGPVTIFTDDNLKVRPIHPKLLPSSLRWGRKKIAHEQGIIAVKEFAGVPTSGSVPKDRVEQLALAVQFATPEIPQPLMMPIDSEGVEFEEEPAYVPVSSEGGGLPEEPEFKAKPLGTVRLVALAAPFDVFNDQTGLLSVRLKGTDLIRFVFGDPVPVTSEVKRKLENVPKIPKDRVPESNVPHIETNGSYIYALWYPFEKWELNRGENE